MEIALKKDDPGKQPVYPSKVGMTEKVGLDLRTWMVTTFMAAAISQHDKFKDYNEIYETCSNAAEETLKRLFPPREGPKVQVGMTEEKGVCAHDGEVVMVQNTFQCMKCKNAVPAELVMRRMKKP